VRRWFVRRLCAALFVFLVSLRYFDRFRLSDQIRPSADPINDLDVIHVADPETWLFQIFKYSHMCRHLYVAIFAINMDVVSLFTDSSSLFLANLHYINVLCQFFLVVAEV